MEVLLVGQSPPPIGGVTVHVQRLLAQLVEKGHQARLLDLTRSTQDASPNLIPLPQNLIKKVLKLTRLEKQFPADTILHFHVSALGRFKWVAPFLMLLFRRNPKVITIHSGSFITKTQGKWDQLYIKWLFAHIQQIIAVSDEQAQYLRELGIAAQKISVIPAYLPQNVDVRLIPPAVQQIPTHKKIVLTSGYLTPLYNYNLLIECIAALQNTDYFFVFAFYNETDPQYEQQIYAQLAPYTNVLILRDQPSDVFVSTLSRCAIYVRTTTRDGDAVAIREAIQLNKTVFATDCVQRPPECHLFANADALLQLFKNYLYNELPSSNQSVTPAFFEQVLHAYASALRV